MKSTPLYSRRIVEYPIRKFHATMEYSYKVSNLSPLIDEGAALLDVLGINLNPAIIWNAVPWSFVIDWLIGIGRWLDNFKVRNLEPVTHIHQYCYSIHIRRVTTLGLGWNAIHDVARITEDAYKRIRTVPDYILAIKSSGLNPKEFSLAAALGISRL
jgi:hypothetical protein